MRVRGFRSDGDVGILVMGRRTSVVAAETTCRTRHWLKVLLVGSIQPGAIGARVTARYGGGPGRRNVRAVELLGQRPRALRAARQLRELTIRWRTAR